MEVVSTILLQVTATHVLEIFDSVRDNIWVHDESSPREFVMQVNEKLVHTLRIFEERCSIDPDCIIAELAKFVYDHSRLYL